MHRLVSWAKYIITPLYCMFSATTILCYHITNSVMETEKYTRPPLSPSTVHLLQIDKQLYITLFQTGGQLFHPTGLQCARSSKVDSLQRKVMPLLLYLAFFCSHIRSSGVLSDGFCLSGLWSPCRFGSAVTFGWNLGLGHSASASWLHMLKMFLLMSDFDLRVYISCLFNFS